MENTSFILPLDSEAARLGNAGGKGANLSILARAGFHVPGGFLVTTDAYREFVDANQLQLWIDEVLSGLRMDDPASLQHASGRIRERFAAAALPAGLGEQLREAYQTLGGQPVAVRSSATAEDLPDMSFAGQQDTYLNVVGEPSLLEAVIKCWSSLWTARAIGYRARNGIAHREVALSVIVQLMVQSEVSGVMFTANPLTGNRTESVIDATLGLGEALVSGQVEPDHYVVNNNTREIQQKHLGAKNLVMRGQSGGGILENRQDASQQQALPDLVIQELVKLGQEVFQVYRDPQDIEWAWAGGKIYLLQSRPITSLFPLPENMPPDPLRVMFAFSAVQGVMEPITPLGRDTLILVLTGSGRAFGYQRDLENQNTIFVAGERLWLDFSGLLKSSIGRKIVPRLAYSIDPGASQAFAALVNDPRLAPDRKLPRFDSLLRGVRFAIPMVWRVLKFWRHPERERERVLRLMDEKVADTRARLSAAEHVWGRFKTGLELLSEARNLFPEMVIPEGIAGVVSGMVPFFGVLERFARQAAQSANDPSLEHVYLEISRGLPRNVTTEMDLFLWQTAHEIKYDPPTEKFMLETPAQELARLYSAKKLPQTSQNVLDRFMDRYGMRGLGEIDLGRPRWREDPTHVMQVVQSYLKIQAPEQAPGAVFKRGAQSAQIAARRLEAAIRNGRLGWLKARVLRWAVSRYRSLAGLREAPKFFAIRMMGITRQGLLESGVSLVEAGELEQADDLFFLHFHELERIGREQYVPAEYPALIRQRRDLRAREIRRKQIPRVLLSDGTAFYEGVKPTSSHGEAAIIGDPVSPGVAEGPVRVVFDPQGTQLHPGEILVCPGTDPAWTPLFLAAGGLVMEVGGMMTHGSVVAREYGIPAVVGVHQATTRLKTGMRVRVDGSTGSVEVLEL